MEEKHRELNGIFIWRAQHHSGTHTYVRQPVLIKLSDGWNTGKDEYDLRNSGGFQRNLNASMGVTRIVTHLLYLATYAVSALIKLIHSNIGVFKYIFPYRMLLALSS